MINKIFNKKGFTVIELLSTIVLSGMIVIVLSTMVGIAVNTYQKLTLDQKLESQANIYITYISRELTNSKPHYIENCNDGVNDIANCINLIHAGDYMIAQDGSVNFDTTSASTSEIKIENEQLYINGSTFASEKYHLINNYTDPNYEDSSLTYTCLNTDADGNCDSAILELTLTIQYIDGFSLIPFTYKTSFII